jgi:lipopolysaccharide heptosyltransferase I
LLRFEESIVRCGVIAQMKILIVKLGAIGDIVHTLPAAAEIRKALPRAEIVWVAEKRSAAILRGSAVFDRLVEIDTRAIKTGRIMKNFRESLREPLRELRDEKFDAAIDFQGLLKSAVIAKMSGAPVRWGFSRSGLREKGARIFYTDTPGDLPPKTHIIKKHLALAAAAFGSAAEPPTLDFPIAVSDADKAEAAEVLRNMNTPFALLNPGGGWPTKLWHAEKFGRLADLIYEQYGMPSIISIGPGEEHLAERALKNSESGAASAVSLSIKAYYELAKHAAVYVGGDTGPTHIAVAAGTPVVGIFGPTEWWRNGSPNPADIEVGRTDIDCRIDCHRRECDKWICMDIDAETVLAAVKRRLG